MIRLKLIRQSRDVNEDVALADKLRKVEESLGNQLKEIIRGKYTKLW